MNNPFDWESFSNKLREQLPQSSIDRSVPSKMDFSWIQRYVEDALEQSLGLTPGKNSSKQPSTKGHKNDETTERNRAGHEPNRLYRLKPKVTNTMTDVIVRIDVPEGLNAKRIRLECNSHRMQIRVLPQQKPQTILMPAKVLHRRAKAICKQGFIEVRLPKHPEEETFYPVNIRHDE